MRLNLCRRPYFVVYGVTDQDHSVSLFRIRLFKNQRHERNSSNTRNPPALLLLNHTKHDSLPSRLPLEMEREFTELDSIPLTELLISEGELQRLLPYLINFM